MFFFFFFVRELRGEVQKVHFWYPKGPFFGSHARPAFPPPQKKKSILATGLDLRMSIQNLKSLVKSRILNASTSGFIPKEKPSKISGYMNCRNVRTCIKIHGSLNVSFTAFKGVLHS